MFNIERTFPYLQAATALTPFAVAVAIRLATGANRFTRVLISLSASWFALNILLAPFTDVTRVGNWLR